MRPSISLMLATTALLALTTTALAMDEPYQEILVKIPADTAIQDLLQNGELDLLDFGDGEVRLVSRPSVTKDLLAQGWDVEIVHADLESFYASRLQGKQPGVWHTYDETFAEMNLLHSQYPNITTAPFSIGQTGEGRDIWAIKVSDNPNVDEDEPEVLYDGMHHAREIMTVELLLYFSRYLCENYGIDPTATSLVDNREIWFVPILNVDGVVYNEMANPGGGGMWRKNRRDNGGDCYGVDPNRNYPFQWEGAGSSTDPCAEDYRGPGAASEPEVLAMMNLVNTRGDTRRAPRPMMRHSIAWRMSGLASTTIWWGKRRSSFTW
jgi:carboxypeptidase T